MSGQYGLGEQLPAGKDLALNYGVSITVIREALSRLKADGLVDSRQGKGVFVAKDTIDRPFRLAKSNEKARAILEVLELRMGSKCRLPVSPPSGGGLPISRRWRSA